MSKYWVSEQFLQRLGVLDDENIRFRSMEVFNEGELYLHQEGVNQFLYINYLDVNGVDIRKDIIYGNAILFRTNNVSIQKEVIPYLIKNNIKIFLGADKMIPVLGNIIFPLNQQDYEKFRLDISKRQADVNLRRRILILRRNHRKHNITDEEFHDYKVYHRNAVDGIEKANAIEQINGYLGNIIHLYYQLFPKFFHYECDWQGKNNPSIISTCLEYASFLLKEHIYLMLHLLGIPPNISLSRISKNNRKGAVIVDLEFEFYPCIVDPIVMTAFNKNYLYFKDFNHWQPGEKLPNIAAEKLSHLFSQKMRSKAKYPGTQVKFNYSGLLYTQCLQIKGILQGKRGTYNPLDLR